MDSPAEDQIEFEMAGHQLQLMIAGAQHALLIKQLHEMVYESRIDQNEIGSVLAKAHGVVALVGGELVGYRFQRELAPEVLGDGELIVRSDFRHVGLGSAIVGYFERTLPDRWKFSIVINSDFYGSLEDKTSTTSFWLRHGYTLVGDSGRTRLFAKMFPS